MGIFDRDSPLKNVNLDLEFMDQLHRRSEIHRENYLATAAPPDPPKRNFIRMAKFALELYLSLYVTPTRA